MKTLNSKARNKLLYAVPAAIASSALVVSFIAPQIARASTSDLSPVSPSQLVSWIQAAHPVPLNGTVTATTSFPIPSALSSSSNAQSVLSGGGSSSQTFNVWANGSGSLRIQQSAQGSESDLYVNPGSVWLWDSAKLTATNELSGNTTNGMNSMSSKDPQLLASQIVAKLSGISALSVSGNTMVAGRPAYTLSVKPLSANSLVGSIHIAVDGQTHIPDEVQVFPKGSTSPAASLGFDTLTFAPQPASIFNFTPPSNAKVVEGSTPKQDTTSNSKAVKTVGTGFDKVLVFAPSGKTPSQFVAMEKALPTISTPLGQGHLYANPIFEAIILPDGTVVAGAVDTSYLLHVVSGL